MSPILSWGDGEPSWSHSDASLHRYDQVGQQLMNIIIQHWPTLLAESIDSNWHSGSTQLFNCTYFQHRTDSPSFIWFCLQSLWYVLFPLDPIRRSSCRYWLSLIWGTGTVWNEQDIETLNIDTSTILDDLNHFQKSWYWFPSTKLTYFQLKQTLESEKALYKAVAKLSSGIRGLTIV